MYLDGFQYESSVLRFFPHSEGYVTVVTDQGMRYFSYVYNYLDHLGNVRLTYSFDTTQNRLKILEENHYYPFGLKHANYNMATREVLRAENSNFKIAPVPPQVTSLPYKYKFQGQERQDELNLNWDSFKWRNYDPAIARFMSVDPLTEEYSDWSPYVFSGNRVVDARELEGLEPYILFANRDAAAKNFGQQYNGKSIIKNREIGATLYSKDVNGKTMYGYNKPHVSTTSDGIVYPKVVPEGAKSEALIHTHSAYDEKLGDGNNKFSDLDIESAEVKQLDSYLVSPDGRLQLYDVDKNKVKEEPISKDMPSDPNPKNTGRVNANNPVESPSPVQTKTVIIKN